MTLGATRGLRMLREGICYRSPYWKSNTFTNIPTWGVGVFLRLLVDHFLVGFHGFSKGTFLIQELPCNRGKQKFRLRQMSDLTTFSHTAEFDQLVCSWKMRSCTRWSSIPDSWRITVRSISSNVTLEHASWTITVTISSRLFTGMKLLWNKGTSLLQPVCFLLGLWLDILYA